MEKFETAMPTELNIRQKVVERLKALAVEGRISCPAARRLAEEMGVPYRLVGEVCNELRIKIKACDLGCF